LREQESDDEGGGGGSGSGELDNLSSLADIEDVLLMQAIQRSMTETPNPGSPAGGAQRLNSSPGQDTPQDKALRLAELRVMMCDPDSMSIEDQMELAIALSMEEPVPKGDDGGEEEEEVTGPMPSEGGTKEENVVAWDTQRAVLQIGVPCTTPSPPAKEKPSGRSPRVASPSLPAPALAPEVGLPPKPASPSETGRGWSGEQDQGRTEDGQDLLGRIGEALRAPSPVLQAVPLAPSNAPPPKLEPVPVSVPDASAAAAANDDDDDDDS
jgi:hypothetical protein